MENTAASINILELRGTPSLSHSYHKARLRLVLISPCSTGMGLGKLMTLI